MGRYEPEHVGMKICLIPARGGSKRIPRKNIRSFRGQPMIAWSISAAAASGCFDQIIVSTDDDEIADVARSAGAEVPFKRPAISLMIRPPRRMSLVMRWIGLFNRAWPVN